jgi:hypothetical protein
VLRTSTAGEDLMASLVVALGGDAVRDDVLVEAAAAGDVEQLVPSADADHRQVQSERRMD